MICKSVIKNAVKEEWQLFFLSSNSCRCFLGSAFYCFIVHVCIMCLFHTASDFARHLGQVSLVRDFSSKWDFLVK